MSADGQLIVASRYSFDKYASLKVYFLRSYTTACKLKKTSRRYLKWHKRRRPPGCKALSASANVWCNVCRPFTLIPRG